MGGKTKAEHSVSDVGAFLQRVLDSSLNGVYVHDVTCGLNTFVNRQYTKLTGYTLDEINSLTGPEFFALFHPEETNQVAEHMRRVQEAADNEIVEIEYRFKTASGRWIWCLSRDSVFARDATGSVTQFIGTFLDITERKQMESALRDSEMRFRLLVDAAVDGIVTISDQGVIESFNPAAEKMFGFAAEEAIGQNARILMPPPRQGWRDDDIQGDVGGRAPITGSDRELAAKKRDGSLFPVYLTVNEIRMAGRRTFAAFFRDLTTQRALEDQLRHSQKMEAIGSLTASIAHDFGNLLMGVLGCANIALSKIDSDAPAAPYLRELSEAAKRGRSLTQQLMSFSRKQVSDPKPLRLDAVVRQTEGLLRRLVGHDIALAIETPPTTATIEADAGQLEQVLVNLVINARDALPVGGRITIRTGETRLDQNGAELRGLATGSYSTLSVIDTGHGMDEATRARVFEPFFTTKEPDKGTGLGLSSVYGIAKQFNGTVQVESALGRGTTFTLFFPRSRAAADASIASEALPTGNETLLVVDDERLVRLTARHYLESLGYTVIEAPQIRDALRLCDETDGAIDLLLTDVVMPGIGGRELANRVRQARAGVRVLFMSAHPTEDLLARGGLRQGDDTISKPFTKSELAIAVRSVLDREGSEQTDVAPEPRARAPRKPPAILLVEDDRASRLALGAYLDDFGYRTIRAASGSEALELARQLEAPIDVLLTDISLPDISGRELAQKLREDAPAMRVIFMSGYSRQDARLKARDNFIQKPVDPGALVETIDVVTG